MPGKTLPESVETLYYGFDWAPVSRREDAAFAVHVTRDSTGQMVRRRHESFKPYGTKSTDPKTGSHH